MFVKIFIFDKGKYSLRCMNRRNKKSGFFYCYDVIVCGKWKLIEYWDKEVLVNSCGNFVI